MKLRAPNRREVSAGWTNHFADSLEGRQDWSIFLDSIASDGAPQVPQRIRDAIEEADVFVCFLAPGTLQSNWVRQEIAIAHQTGKPMVPVFHEDFKQGQEEHMHEPAVRHC